MTRSHRNPYAQALREQIRTGATPDELVDKLLVSSLIEARSCERFKLLAEETDDSELKKIYSGLWSSEFDHFKVFLELASLIESKHLVEKRWEWFLKKEAMIIRSQCYSPTMHSYL